MSSAPGTRVSARSRVCSASRSLRSATASSRGRPFRLATGPSGVNVSVSTPHGTTLIEDRCTPRLARSETSAEWVATTAAALRPMAGSSLMRAADASSACTPMRRSATPSELNSWMTGMLRSRAAASAARPLVQCSACTTSGRSLSNRLRSGPLNAGTRSSRPASPCSPSAGPGGTGPALRCSTHTPSWSLARAGWPACCFCAYTVTRCPCLASIRVSSLSPRSSLSGPGPARGLRGVACCATRAIFIYGLLVDGLPHGVAEKAEKWHPIRTLRDNKPSRCVPPSWTPPTDQDIPNR